MSLSKVFLYAEVQVSVPFSPLDWHAVNAEMKKEKGLLTKTWLSGVNTNTVGGFYEFDSVENARAYAEGFLAQTAKHVGGSLTVKLFDGDVVAQASRDMGSPHYSQHDFQVFGEIQKNK